eukprot:365071-Chlamydomonas_euryale.AAC.6
MMNIGAWSRAARSFTTTSPNASPHQRAPPEVQDDDHGRDPGPHAHPHQPAPLQVHTNEPHLKSRMMNIGAWSRAARSSTPTSPNASPHQRAPPEV